MELQLSTIAFSIINYCSCYCKHCSVNSGQKLKAYLNADIILKVCSEAKKMGILPENSPIALSGGEVSLHPEITKIIKGIKSLGYRINMSTTGSNFSEEQIKEIAPLLNIVSFSIDGDENEHDAFRRTKGSYIKTLWAIDKFQKYKAANIAIQHTVHRANFNNINKIMELANSLKVQHVRLIPMLPLGRAEISFPSDIFLDNSDMLMLLQKIIYYNGYYTNMDTTSIVELRSFLLNHPQKVLGIDGIKSFEIDAYGGLFPHGAMPDMYNVGSLYEESFEDLINKFINSDMLNTYLNLCSDIYDKFVINGKDIALCWEKEKQLEAEKRNKEKQSCLELLS